MSLKELVPYLSVSNASQAIEFYSQVFECEPKVLLKMPDGRIMHCEYNLGGARLFLSEELPEHGGTPSPASLGSTQSRFTCMSGTAMKRLSEWNPSEQKSWTRPKIYSGANDLRA